MSEIRRVYEQQDAWGLSISIDLHGCEQESITSEDKIGEYVTEVCKFIGIVPTGNCQIAESGVNDTIKGYSFCQFFAGGIISGHMVASSVSAYLDIFSPSYFEPESVTAFAEKFFGAQEAVLHYAIRTK